MRPIAWLPRKVQLSWHNAELCSYKSRWSRLKVNLDWLHFILSSSFTSHETIPYQIPPGSNLTLSVLRQKPKRFNISFLFVFYAFALEVSIQFYNFCYVTIRFAPLLDGCMEWEAEASRKKKSLGVLQAIIARTLRLIFPNAAEISSRWMNGASGDEWMVALN